jgi:hypothetical protein
MMPENSTAHPETTMPDAGPLPERGMTREEEQSLWLHRAIAGHLARNPGALLGLARENLTGLTEAHPRSAVYIEQWRAVIDAGVDAVFVTLASTEPDARELRQNTPFAGALAHDERMDILAAFREHWQRSHADDT